MMIFESCILAHLVLSVLCYKLVSPKEGWKRLGLSLLPIYNLYLLGCLVFSKNTSVEPLPQPIVGEGNNIDGKQEQPKDIAIKNSSQTIAPAKLLCLNGRYKGSEFEIPPEGVVIGRDPAFAHIILAEQAVSKCHVKIHPDPFDVDAIIIEDMNSLNGNYRLIVEQDATIVLKMQDGQECHLLQKRY